MQAIETIYKGYRFRSRLEARWAVFFDECKIKYQYEPQGFESDGGVRYLPDFYLPVTDSWVEVKGENHALKTDWKRMAAILDAGACSGGLVLLGEIPFVPSYNNCQQVVMHPNLMKKGGAIERDWVFFVDGDSATDLRSGAYAIGDTSWVMRAMLDIPLLKDLKDGPSDGWLVDHKIVHTVFTVPSVLSAYATARAARFEHGETPRP